AEYGTQTVTLSRAVGASGRVVAVEANAWTCSLLHRTVEENGLANVDVVHAAIAGQDGPVAFSDDRDATASNSLASSGATVPGKLLDTLVKEQGISRIDLLKINIEGAEGAALAGMHETMPLVRNVVVSCHDFRADRGESEWFRTSAAVDAALAAWDFQVFRRPTDHRPWIRGYRYATAGSSRPA